MTTMIAEVYEAFISVGIKEEKAKAAAIALSSEAKSESQHIKTDLKEIVEEINTRTQKVEKDIQRIEKNIYRIDFKMDGTAVKVITILTKFSRRCIYFVITILKKIICWIYLVKLCQHYF